MSGRAQFGSRNGMFGKHHSEETKAKMRAKVLGKHLSEETKIKLRIKLTGKRRSEETKLKIKNRPPLSEDARTRISQANTGERNGMWKGDNATEDAGRNRAKRRYECPTGMERHHIDGNPLNNSPENITFVTRKEHMMSDGRLFRRNNQGKFTRDAL